MKPHVVLALAVSLVAVASKSASALQRTIPGTIVLENPDGSRRDHLEGSIECCTDGSGSARELVRVRDGAFSLILPAGQNRLCFGRIRLDGRACWTATRWDRDVPRSLELVVHPIRPLTLRIVDVDTGTDLRDCRLVPRNTSSQDPAPLGTFESPFEVPQFSDRADLGPGWIGIVEYSVESPGYETLHLWVDPREGGTRTFELAEEARLDVFVRGDSTSRSRAKLVVTRSGTQTIWSSTPIPIDGALALHSLPGGEFTVSVVPAHGPLDQFGPPSDVVLVSGESRLLEIFGPPSPSQQVLVDLCGSLRLPEHIDPLSIRLRFTPGPRHSYATLPVADVTGDLLAQDPHDARLFHWYAARVGTGVWRASIPELGWSREIAAMSGLRVELLADRPSPDTGPFSPAPVTRPRLPDSAYTVVPIRIVDGQTGKVLGPDDVVLAGPHDPSEDSSAVGTWDATREQWKVRKYADDPLVIVKSRRRPVVKRTFVLDALFEAQQVKIWPDQLVPVKVYDGDARIAPPEIEADLPIFVEPVDHAGEGLDVTYPRSDESELHVPVSAPGRYRFSLRDSPRYAPHPPIEIEVNPGEQPPVVVFRLTRAPRPK